MLTAGHRPASRRSVGQSLSSSPARRSYYEDLAFAVAEGETDWVKLLDYSIATMHENGSLSEMSKTWYNGLDLTVKE